MNLDQVTPQAEALDSLKLPPLPPAELRRLVCHDDTLFEIHEGVPVFADVPLESYESVLDFGCGCGRIARQLMCQPVLLRRYLGIDIHRGMIEWCRSNLTPFDPRFEFLHHDVYNPGLGPDNTRRSTQPFPVNDGEISLLIAHSVFTHLYKEQTEFYLSETARVLRPGGLARTTWFLFDKTTFPMMFDFQVCLYINERDPSNAVIYDWRWFLGQVERVGLTIQKVTPPALRGFQWEVYLSKQSDAGTQAFPVDEETLSHLSGSGFDSPVPKTAVEIPDASPPVIVRPETTRLRYTSDISETEFLQRTGQIESWYHSYYFDNGFSVIGDYDIGADVSGYGFPASMEGLSVLDIGTGGGWFAHWFEQLGAEVTTVDARGYCDFDVYGRPFHPPIETEGRPPDRVDVDGRPIYYSPVSRAFWIMRDILGSKVRYVNGRAYDVRPELFDGRRFDLVFLGAILCHLRDPIGALMAARSVSLGQVIASTPVVVGEPSETTLPRQYLPYTEIDKISWWLPNEACFRHWFLAAGFKNVDISRQVTLRADNVRIDGGRAVNGDQILRVGIASVRGSSAEPP